jgi:hypothetical protein
MSIAPVYVVVRLKLFSSTKSFFPNKGISLSCTDFLRLINEFQETSKSLSGDVFQCIESHNVPWSIVIQIIELLGSIIQPAKWRDVFSF